MDHEGRRERIVARLPELEVEGMLVTRLPNVRYLTGFTGSNGQLFLAASGPVFLTDRRYEEQSRRQVGDLRREVYNAPEFPALFARLCREAGARRVAFESADVSYRTYEELRDAGDAELVPVAEEVERLRRTKEPEEVLLIARAQEATDEAFERVLPKLAEGATEREVAFELEQAMRLAGAERVGFDTIVAFGENAAEPHHGPTDRPLSPGDVVKMDFGCVVDGYHSDMTRTVAFGDPEERLREIHQVVLRAQEAGIAALRPGARCGDVDEAARSVIREAGYGDQFGHSLGHGVGLEIHEGPGLRATSDEVVPEATVVTVEPGIYVPGLGGIRVEDMVEVTGDGIRAMPRSQRDLMVLPP